MVSVVLGVLSSQAVSKAVQATSATMSRTLADFISNSLGRGVGPLVCMVVVVRAGLKPCGGSHPIPM